MSETFCDTTQTNITAVDIARDVIKGLDAKKLIAESGVYFEPGFGNYVGDYQGFSHNKEKMKALVKSPTKCKVCAIGGLFTSLVCHDLPFELKKVGHNLSDKMRDALAPYFSPEQLAQIEMAFEIDPFYGDRLDIPYEKAIAFGEAHNKDDARLRAICQNIIDNEGVFKP